MRGSRFGEFALLSEEALAVLSGSICMRRRGS